MVPFGLYRKIRTHFTKNLQNFDLTSTTKMPTVLTIPNRMTISTMLNVVLQHPTVCSKRFLTNKVDRSVTGLIAQQQCIGLLHTPVADVAVTAISYFDTVSHLNFKFLSGDSNCLDVHGSFFQNFRNKVIACFFYN